MISSH